jgi:hypothetical protein
VRWGVCVRERWMDKEWKVEEEEAAKQGCLKTAKEVADVVNMNVISASYFALIGGFKLSVDQSASSRWRILSTSHFWPPFPSLCFCCFLAFLPPSVAVAVVNSCCFAVAIVVSLLRQCSHTLNSRRRWRLRIDTES